MFYHFMFSLRAVLCAVLLLVVVFPVWAQPTMVVDINQNAAVDRNSSDASWLAVYNGKLYFQADDGTHGETLWAYDAGTDMAGRVVDIQSGLSPSGPRFLTPYEGKLYFTARDFSHGNELWIYDGTTGELYLAADIWPGEESAYPEDVIVYGGRFYFSAEDEEHGNELWSYDPATGQASLAADIVPGSRGSSPYSFAVYEDKLYFATDRADEGLKVYDAATGQVSVVANTDSFREPSPKIIYDGKLFFTANDGIHGREVWIYDEGTNHVALVADIVSQKEYPEFEFFIVYNNKLYFSVDDGDFNEDLWSYDALTGQASRVVDGESTRVYPQGLMAAVNSKLYFSAEEDVHGRELWSYDSETGEALFVADIRPGDRSSQPRWLTPYNGKLYFAANDGVHGEELWVFDGTSAVAVEPEADDLPATFRLSPAIPNPFRNRTRFTLTIQRAQPVQIALYDLWGRRLRVLFDGPMATGAYRDITVEAKELPSGVYYVRAAGADFAVTQSVVLVH